MAKSIIFIFAALTLSISGFAQNTIKGRVIDENGTPLSYATVALLNPADSTLLFFGVTKDDGVYQIRQVKNGAYIMQFSFVGMETACDKLTIPYSSGEDFGDKILKANMLEEVIVEAELIPIKFKSDTLEYDVKAFKTRPGAVVEELLEKLPGIEVDGEGNVKAEGEEVTKVLVDGKEFFDKDPKVATKNLPAKALEKVQVYDKKSEEAVFTGVDDGVRDRTINLLLNEDHKKGYFGQISAGAGTNETFKAEAKVYRFSKTIQTAVLGMYNNINEFGYSHKGNQQFGQGSKGLNTALAGGLNLSYNTKGFNRYFFSYLGNSRKKELEEDISTENFLPQGAYEQIQQIVETEKDRPHKFNLGIRHDFDKKNRLIIDADAQVSKNDVMSHRLTDSEFENMLINQSDNKTDNNSEMANFNSKAVYITKFNEDKTQIKTNFNLFYNDSKTHLDWNNFTTFYNPFGESIVDQYRNNEMNRYGFSASPTFVQKIKKFWSVSAGAGLGFNKQNLKRQESTLNSDGEFIDSPIPGFSTRESFVKPSISFNRSSKKYQLDIALQAVSSQFDKVLNNNSIEKPVYFHFTPRLSFQSDYRSGRRIALRYVSNVNMPTVGQLYPVVDSINQLAVYQGNIDLKPEYSHNLNLSWSLFDQFSFTSLFVRLNGSHTKDKISWSQSVNDQFVKTTTPINVDYRNEAGSYIDFTTPVRALGVNVNIRSWESWNKGIVYINEEENINTNLTHYIYLSFENRNKDKWHVKAGGSFSFTDSKYSVVKEQNNTYYNTTYFTNFRFTPSKKWNFDARANVVNYNSQTFEESVNVPLITASVRYHFLQAEKAWVTLRAYDLLNKFVGFKQISDTNFISQREWNTIGRYVLLSFNMRIR